MYKLTIELIPRTSWYNNLRKAMSQPAWDRVRKQVYAEYGYRCGICGAGGRLNCHEEWEYDEETHTQRLKGFIALCDLCHHVKHIGLAEVFARQGKINYSRVVQHFINVNNCDYEAFEQHKAEAFLQWNKRSQHDWNIDLGIYKNLFENQ